MIMMMVMMMMMLAKYKYHKNKTTGKILQNRNTGFTHQCRKKSKTRTPLLSSIRSSHQGGEEGMQGKGKKCDELINQSMLERWWKRDGEGRKGEWEWEENNNNSMQTNE